MMHNEYFSTFIGYYDDEAKEYMQQSSAIDGDEGKLAIKHKNEYSYYILLNQSNEGQLLYNYCITNRSFYASSDGKVVSKEDTITVKVAEEDNRPCRLGV